ILPAPGRENELTDRAGRPLPGMIWVRGPATKDGLLRQVAVEVAAFLASDHSLGGRPVTSADIAVLTRSNADALAVQAHLIRLGVRAVMHGDRSVFEQPEALDLRRILRALAEPSRSVLLRTALAS